MIYLNDSKNNKKLNAIESDLHTASSSCIFLRMTDGPTAKTHTSVTETHDDLRDISLLLTTNTETTSTFSPDIVKKYIVNIYNYK